MALYDDGTHGDIRAGDFIFSLQTPISSDSQGVVEISVQARDSDGNLADSSISLLVRGIGDDVQAPGKVKDLFAQRNDDDPTACDISFTAPGDDAFAGQAERYELRYGVEPFYASSFEDATLYSQSVTWTPGQAGTKEQKTVTGLDAETTYYFALKAFDEADNASAMSNLASTAAQPDEIPPSNIADLVAQEGPLEGQITLLFTAPGDDGTVGTVVGYELRYSESYINETNWDALDVYQPSLQWQPRTSGDPESKVITGFDAGTTYYFAIKSVDDVGNWSGVSNNAAAGGGVDKVPPKAIDDLVALESEVEGRVMLSFTATGDDGDAGTATRYLLKFYDSEISVVNWTLASTYQPSLSWSPRESGQMEMKTVEGLVAGRTYYFALKAFDDSQNESGISNSPSATAGQDLVAPSSVTNLSASPGDGLVTLRFTATGDNGIVGQATSYELRHSLSEIGAANWSDATVYEPSRYYSPQPAGSQETFQVKGLTVNVLHYFAIKVFDEAQNASGVSNCASAMPTGETTPPSPVLDLAARSWLDAGEIRISFTASGDNGRFGTANGYELRLFTEPIGDENWAAGTIYTPSLVWAPQKSGSPEEFVLENLATGFDYYIALKVFDDCGNYSDVSNCVLSRPCDGSPTAAIMVNADEFQVGDNLRADFLCYNAGEAVDLDLYAVIVMPDGTMLNLPDLGPVMIPFEWRPLPGYYCPEPFNVLDVELVAPTAPGQYTIYTAFCLPFTLSPVTDIWVTNFTVK